MTEVTHNMKKFAVSWISFYDNILHLEFVDAEDWEEALFKVSTFKFDSVEEMDEYGIEDAKREAFDSDCMFEVKEVVC